MEQITELNLTRVDLKGKSIYLVVRASKALRIPVDELDIDFRLESALRAIRAVNPGVADAIERLIIAYENALTFLDRFKATQHSASPDPRDEQQYGSLVQACKDAKTHMFVCFKTIEQNA